MLHPEAAAVSCDCGYAVSSFWTQSIPQDRCASLRWPSLPFLEGELAKLGLGLAYVPEPLFAEEIRRGRLTVVLDAYAASVPGYFIYYPSRAQRSTALRLFIDVAKELLLGEHEQRKSR